LTGKDQILIEPSFKEKCATIVGSNNLISIAPDMAAFGRDVWNWYRGRAAFVLAPQGRQMKLRESWLPPARNRGRLFRKTATFRQLQQITTWPI
jgi:hypothetical protein